VNHTLIPWISGVTSVSQDNLGYYMTDTGGNRILMYDSIQTTTLIGNGSDVTHFENGGPVYSIKAPGHTCPGPDNVLYFTLKDEGVIFEYNRNTSTVMVVAGKWKQNGYSLGGLGDNLLTE
jgi:hypothetical protein